MVSSEQLVQVVAALRRRGFEADFFPTAAAAAEAARAEIDRVGCVGWGGSESVKELGLRDYALAAGKEVRDHALDGDLFLLSANALTLDGRIVNIDGCGNRVAASIAGPKRVLYVVGANKVVAGGIDAAIARIKAEACPRNARRLQRPTPCAETGVCADCDLAERMCRVTAVFDRKPTGIAARVLVVGEALGY